MKFKDFKKKHKDWFTSVDYAGLISIAVLDLRISKGLTQAKLAKKCGMKQEAIARIEAGDTIPTVKPLLEFVKHLIKN